MARIDDVKAKLAASIDRKGKPLKGYSKRVAALKAEITRLEAPAVTPVDPPLTDEPEPA